MCVWYYVLLFYFVAVHGHQNKLQNEDETQTSEVQELKSIETKGQSDAELQSQLMPQELNPAFVPDQNDPWRVVLPTTARKRRDTEITAIPTHMNEFKKYSRLGACIALAIAATVEIVIYFVEFYNAQV